MIGASEKPFPHTCLTLLFTRRVYLNLTVDQEVDGTTGKTVWHVVLDLSMTIKIFSRLRHWVLKTQKNYDRHINLEYYFQSFVSDVTF